MYLLLFELYFLILVRTQKSKRLFDYISRIFYVITGDRIVSVNGESVSGKSYAEVVALIQRLRDNLSLIVVPKQDDILQMVKKENVTITDEMKMKIVLQCPICAKTFWRKIGSWAQKHEIYSHFNKKFVKTAVSVSFEKIHWFHVIFIKRCEWISVISTLCGERNLWSHSSRLFYRNFPL